MSEEMMDTFAIVDWEAEVDAPYDASVAGAASSSGGGAGGSGPGPVVGADILGGRADGVPCDLHRTMVAMAQDWHLPITSILQRGRNKPKSSFRCPEYFAAALAHGYIHPHLPPPRGYKWVATCGRFILLQIGG